MLALVVGKYIPAQSRVWVALGGLFKDSQKKC